MHVRIKNLIAWGWLSSLRFIFLTNPKENNMKYPLLAAALLALIVSACDSKKEEATVAPVSEPIAIPAEQPPAPVEDVPPATEPSAVDVAPDPVGEAPAPAAVEEQPAPAVETK
jgi:hypothetical protein